MLVKYVLLLILFISIFIISYFMSANFFNNDINRHSKDNYYCNNKIANCNESNSPDIPKGVCKPGGKCT